MISFKGISFDLSKKNKQLAKAQDAVDKKAIELMEAYVPVANKKYANSGKMSKSHKQEKPGVIVNTEPKARREYYENKGFSGPNRGKQWLNRMKADHLAEIKAEAAKELSE